jgi:hypothetical protein
MTNKQTAMQEMYYDLLQKHTVYTKLGMINKATSLVSSIELAEHLISKEKEQIIDAVDYGCSDWGSGKDSEKYYNDEYGK